MKIFYGVAGEGLGHASRTLAMVDALPEHEIHIFTFGKAFQFLTDIKYPYLHKINGILFPYKNSKIDYKKLCADILRFRFSGLKENINLICDKSKELNPDLFIADFEPSIPRVAKQLGKKYISIDNQHRFVCCDLSDLPFGLRTYARLVGLATSILIPKPDYTIVSTFHFDCIKSDKSITLTNGLLRKSVENTKIDNAGFILVYLRQSVNDKILRLLSGINRYFIVYGATDGDLKSKLSKRSNFEFHSLSNQFVQHLATCDKIISTAGNQLISEVRFYQKPILVVPEPRQYEQYINAYYVQKLGLGSSFEIDKLTSEDIELFVNKWSKEFNIKPKSNGVYDVVKLINSI